MPRTRRPRLDWRRPEHVLALGFGIGLAPVAPGTWGSLLGVALFVLLLAALPAIAFAGVVLAGFALGVWACERTGADLEAHDHGSIVWDEVVGVWLALAATLPGWGTVAPPGPPAWTQWAWVVAGFAIFRVLDIAKPGPIAWLDARIRGGLGVMLDDAVAGLITAAVILAGRFASGT